MESKRERKKEKIRKGKVYEKIKKLVDHQHSRLEKQHIPLRSAEEKMMFPFFFWTTKDVFPEFRIVGFYIYFHS